MRVYSDFHTFVGLVTPHPRGIQEESEQYVTYCRLQGLRDNDHGSILGLGRARKILGV